MSQTRYLLAAAAWLLSGCSRPEAVEALLPDVSQLPSFALTDQAGNPFSNTDLRNNVWVWNFIFTRCTNVCPRMSEEMRKVQSAVAGMSQVRLASVTIDPEYDGPQVLREYASRYQADPRRWIFLTGDKSVIRNLQLRTSRHLDPEEITGHSKQFLLVDREGFVRGIYSMNQPGKLDELLSDLRQLLRNPARPQAIDP